MNRTCTGLVEKVVIVTKHNYFVFLMKCVFNRNTLVKGGMAPVDVFLNRYSRQRCSMVGDGNCPSTALRLLSLALNRDILIFE